MIDYKAEIPARVVYETDHTDGDGNLVVKVKSRTDDEITAFSLLGLGYLWKGLIEYESWRVGYCEGNRHTSLPSDFRAGILDTNTITYAMKIRLKEVK